jgi:tetratricopeptide (TPR) repeat protein
MTTDTDWEERVASLWASFDTQAPDAFRARIDALAAERPPGDALALFERACANDSTSREEHAAPLYRAALAAGLTGIRRRRAVIQLASTLRNLGQADEGIRLLTIERTQPSDELDDAVAATFALCLADSGRAREATGVVLAALAKHLPRYNRSMANYARALIGE